MRKARILRTIWIQLYAMLIGKHQGLEIALMLLALDMVFLLEHSTEQGLATGQTLRLARDSTMDLSQSE
jgi:hypothetical protein